MIQAETKKSVEEIKEKTKTEEKRIAAEFELKAQIIKGETSIISVKIRAEGEAEKKTIEVDAKNYCDKKMAD